MRGTLMDVDVVTKPPFAVIGIEGCGRADQGPRWIAPLWEKARSRRVEVEHLIIGEGWGLMSAVDRYLERWGDQGKYLAGWEASLEAQPPKGWIIWRVPKTTFAVVRCTVESYAAAWREFHEVFLRSGEYEPAGAVHEFYPKKFLNPATDLLCLYFTIKKA
ncbi:MAG TPA: GyrI-like domain-containing protein [Verrucomicrobiae bacterium]|nr:GyrI-like domain-containing protein [Verrucomicrobiae bacterium]